MRRGAGTRERRWIETKMRKRGRQRHRWRTRANAEKKIDENDAEEVVVYEYSFRGWAGMCAEET